MKFSCRTNLQAVAADSTELPIIIALHGGSYTSRYFDVPGCSLLSRAAALKIPFAAVDRPGYGGSAAPETFDYSHEANATVLDKAIGELWSVFGRLGSGVVLIGHSIGGAIALRIAARNPTWPLLGVAISGLGMKIAPSAAQEGETFPANPFLDIPQALKAQQMFGPDGSFLPAAQEASRCADALLPTPELIDIVATWPREAAAVLARVGVPIHYRQGQYDNLWIVSLREIQQFVSACTSAPWVDARLVEKAGHCIDFHRPGAGFQLEQLAFALRCSSDREERGS